VYEGKKVSVVIPAYNEEEGIASVVKDFSKSFVDEIVVVDNNCTDRTAEFARKAGAKVVKQPKQGYGNALRKGMSVAKGDLVFLTESDSTFYGEDMKKLLRFIDKYDMVLGTRTHRAFIEKGAKMNWMLYYGNIGLGKLIQMRFLGKAKLTDVGCTFRVIKKDALKKILNQLTVGGSAFSPEMIVVSLKNGLSLMEVPVRYRARIGQSKITASHSKSIKVGLRMLKVIFFR
jgi:glycosyltransferase involved in cell wall biosynthesis